MLYFTLVNKKKISKEIKRKVKKEKKSETFNSESDKITYEE